MRRPYTLKGVFAVLLSFIFVASCSGQNEPKQNKPLTTNDKTPLGQTKIRKTQGANEYQNIHCGLQDKKGDLWFGTTGEGVYRYDGNVFTQYTVKDGLSSNTVWSILEDTKGNIWFGTDMGSCRYDGKAISYVPFTTSNTNLYTGDVPHTATEHKNAVWSMRQDRTGMIWMGADDGLYCYNGTTFTRPLNSPGIINDSNVTLKSIQCMLEDSKGNIWLGSGPMAFEGICRYDGKSISNYKPQNARWIRNIIEHKNGNIMFATRSNGVCSYDGKRFAYVDLWQGKVKGSIMSCLQDRSGNIWYASDYGTELNDTVGGAWRYDGTSFTKYSTKDGLINNSVFLILEDRDTNIWVGTRNIGLYRFNGTSFDSFSE